jgi:hypothetical protein
VSISLEEAIDLNYPKSCLGSALSLGARLPYRDFYLVDRRRVIRMRRRADKQRRAAHARFLEQVAEIEGSRERMKRDVRYFLEVCGLPQPSNHPGILALLEVLADPAERPWVLERLRGEIRAIPYKPPNPQFLDIINRMERERLKMYGNEVREMLVGLGERDG